MYETVEDFAVNHAVYGFNFGQEIIFAFINMYIMCLSHFQMAFMFSLYLVGIGYIAIT